MCNFPLNQFSAIQDGSLGNTTLSEGSYTFTITISLYDFEKISSSAAQSTFS